MSQHSLGVFKRGENISPVRPNPIYYIREYENISENISPARPNSPGGLFRPSIWWAVVSQFCSRVGCTAIMLITFQVSWTHLNLSRTPRQLCNLPSHWDQLYGRFSPPPSLHFQFWLLCDLCQKKDHNQEKVRGQLAPWRKPGFTVSLEAEEERWWGSEMQVSNSEKSKVSKFCCPTWNIGRVLVLWWWW